MADRNSFTPRIDPTRFGREILEIQDQEGNSGRVTARVQVRLKTYESMGIYAAFLQICADYHIHFEGVYHAAADQPYRLSIFTHNREWFYFDYLNRDRDMSVLLAKKLYEVLFVQIDNEAFVKGTREE